MPSSGRLTLLDMAVRPVNHERGLFVWALDDGTGVRTGQFRDSAEPLADWITHRYPGPLMIRGPGTERLVDEMGGRVCLDPSPAETFEIDRVLSQYEAEVVGALPRLLLATDGSADSNNHVGLAWVADDGRHRAVGWHQRGSRQVNACRSEFAAVVSAIDSLNPGRRVELLLDSRTVLTDVQLAIQGRPVRFGSRLPTRTVSRLAEMDIRATWVKGHRGHWLNETADHLAVYARRCSAAGVEPRTSVMQDIVERQIVPELVGQVG